MSTKNVPPEVVADQLYGTPRVGVTYCCMCRREFLKYDTFLDHMAECGVVSEIEALEQAEPEGEVIHHAQE